MTDVTRHDQVFDEMRVGESREFRRRLHYLDSSLPAGWSAYRVDIATKSGSGIGGRHVRTVYDAEGPQGTVRCPNDSSLADEAWAMADPDEYRRRVAARKEQAAKRAAERAAVEAAIRDGAPGELTYDQQTFRPVVQLSCSEYLRLVEALKDTVAS